MKNLSNHFLIVLTVLCLLASPVFADGDLAALEAGPAGISFLLDSTHHESVTITINGPGDLSLRKTFEAGTALVVELFDEAGHALPDGAYSYELRVQPRLGAGLRAELEAARAAGDTQAADRLRAAGILPPKRALVQSGYFTVVNGGVVLPDASAVESEGQDEAVFAQREEIGIPLKDDVVDDDLIVQGNLCVGLDCDDGEDFGTDIVRIKANNVRVKFDDATTSGSFPMNDWQLTINDSANNGAERFSIDDVTGATTPLTIEAGAPDHATYVDDSGNLGLGTSTPGVDLHVVEGDTPTLRLEQDSSESLTPQTWDVAANEESFSIVDATNSATPVFSIEAGAPADAIFVEDSGRVGIGTDTPGQALEVDGGLQVKHTDGGQASLFLTSTGGTRDVSYILRTNPDLAGVGGFNISLGGTSPFRIFNGAANQTLDITTTGISVNGTAAITGSLSVNGVNLPYGNTLGLGTSSPQANLHIVDGDTPTIRLEQDSSGALTPQTWDVAANDTSFSILDASNSATPVLSLEPGAPADSIFVTDDGRVGIGTDTPGQKLDVLGGDAMVRRTDGSQASLLLVSDGSANPTGFILRANQTAAGVGGFMITEAGGSSPFRIFKGAAANTLDITTTGVNVVGTLSVNGTAVNVPDFVFEADFPLETIEEHAAFMWENKHLPAVKPAQFDENGRTRIDLGGNQMGMLEELEKAHIYIDQLNNDLKDKDEKIAALEMLTAELSARLSHLEGEQN